MRKMRGPKSSSATVGDLEANRNGINSGDPRILDAADTLVSLAHSAASTPTVESKPIVAAPKTTTTTNTFEIVNFIFFSCNF